MKFPLQVLEMRMKLALSIVLPTMYMLSACGGPSQPDFQIGGGDRISLVGNALADRMQHDGWLETLLHSRFPEDDLVIRNLGFAGDELSTQLRSRDFGTPDDHLRRSEANVIFAFFGYNESFAGGEGLEQFREDLKSYVEHTLPQRYDPPLGGFDGDTAGVKASSRIP